MRPLSGLRVSATGGSSHDRAASDHGIAPVLVAPLRSNLTVGLRADVARDPPVSLTG